MTTYSRALATSCARLEATTSGRNEVSGWRTDRPAFLTG